ncbi:hypothetical protein GQ602_006696 [Ophiocordyceps camponoti-floridani]|uniref:Myb-like domain-containing protein n=1 Tax=Ophiocordyceps camponoti-floridani TaxID=2030778 RepID=A0A8H4Q1S9_9HYPO|nr:hypothetical protein GQ602_006696 [Ophiocordyceps camponoti-floridani]
MSSKNWNDRADKDLFFTILSVKNIGVISGAEWTTIGNHMRTLGYGFTNEGCRQHFQGLRRAQNKADANGVVVDTASPRRVDPTLNPITRRPGPGRGRPRKQSHQDLSQQSSPVQPNTAVPPTVMPQGAVPVAVSVPVPVPVQYTGAIPGPYYGAVPANMTAATMGQPRRSQEPPSHGPDKATTADGSQRPSVEAACDSPRPALLPTDPPPVDHGEEADVDAEGAESAGPMEAAEQMEGHDEPPLKRQKMEPHDAESESLGDEAVLALAAHNGSTGPDPYGSDFDYHGEA